MSAQVKPTPSCAICESPLLADQKFLLIGHESAHRSCAKTGAKTAGSKLTVEMAANRARLDRMVAEHAQLVSRVERLEQHQVAHDALVTALRQELEQLRAETFAARRAFQKQIADLAADRDRLIAQAAELQARSISESTEDLTGLDDAAARFRLLELDPL